MRTSCLLLALLFAQETPSEETLYNGIRLPAWPRKAADLSKDLDLPSYVKSPPAVIPIDLGRQLFVDDFLIAETTLKRVYHQAKYHPKTPVMRPDKPWEADNDGGGIAMSFSDG